MKTQLAAAISDNAKTLQNELAALPGLLRKIRDESGKAFPLSAIIPERDESIISLISRARDIARLGSSSNLGAVSSTVPNSQLQVFNQKILEMVTSAQSITNFARNNEEVRTINPNTFLVIDNAGTATEMRNWLYQIYDRVEELLNLNVTSYLFRKLKDRDSVSDTKKDVTEILRDASTQFEQIAYDASEAGNLVGKIEENFEALKETATEASRLSEQTQKDRKTVQDYLGEVTTNSAAIKQIVQDATSLETAISSYRPKFEQFQEDLDEREDELQSGNAKLLALQESLEKQEAHLVSLTTRGEEMLSLTTTAGLSSNYLAAVNKLTRELMWSRISFYTGIAVLFVSAAPLFANAIIPLVAVLNPDIQKLAESVAHPANQEPWQYVAQAFARLVILVPAAWLVTFSAKRHSSLFKLREHYAFKYSLAASVEGFKKEASKYGDEIAATVFAELSFNPAERLDHQDLDAHKAPNPFLQKMLDLIQSAGREPTTK